VAGLDRMIEAYPPDTCIVLATINANVPSRIGSRYHHHNDVAEEFNAALAERADVLVDWDQDANEDPERFLRWDRRHPTEEGSGLLAELVADAVAECRSTSS
jgi:lysophospholipase L1-like esterase